MWKGGIVVICTLIISVFNLALGYALALCLQSWGISPAWPRRLLWRLGLLVPAGDEAGHEGRRHDETGAAAALPRGAHADSAPKAEPAIPSEIRSLPADDDAPISRAALSGAANIVQLKFSDAGAPVGEPETRES
jgi:hypothetical protein